MFYALVITISTHVQLQDLHIFNLCMRTAEYADICSVICRHETWLSFHELTALIFPVFTHMRFAKSVIWNVILVHSNAHKVIAGFFLSPDPDVT
jgi:hypothetical protein